MNFIAKAPITCLLILINVAVFFVNFFTINSFAEPEWTLHLLNLGALFSPYTLDEQWYRIFSHMFMHAGIIHILFNMYALFSVGSEVESEIGFKKFLWVYFCAGIASALASMYWSLFSIGVGASGAIFGLFGFSLFNNLLRSRQLGYSLAPIFLNFCIFMGINLYFAKAFNADTAAHLGGLVCGIVLGIFSAMRSEWLQRVKVEYAFIPLFVIIYSVMPRYQVTYFKFFQYVLAAEDSAYQFFNKNITDDDYLAGLKKGNARWDTALTLLNRHNYLPVALHSDTLKLRQYLNLRKQEYTFRIKMIEDESFTYLDSIDITLDSMRHFSKLDYSLKMSYPQKNEQAQVPMPAQSLDTVRILYNEDWEEIAHAPFQYYRIGFRDSLGRWQGSVHDFYANGTVQMKGSYTNDEKNGVFLYYSDHKTYTSAGRYRNDIAIGKWETFHDNGKKQSEIYYTDRYFLKNLWDSSGNQLVKDGNGRVILHHANGVVLEEGEYRDGYKEGYWYGQHANGDMHFQENYYRNRLVNGRSRNLEGETFVYDETSLYALPLGGAQQFKAYTKSVVKEMDVSKKGKVQLSFRVTEKGKITDIKVEQSVSREVDEIAKQILKEGPRWIPAKVHGHINVDGFGYCEIEF